MTLLPPPATDAPIHPAVGVGSRSGPSETASSHTASSETAIGAGDRWLVVRAGSRLCALPVRDVVETMRPLPVEPVAGAPSFVRGIAVVRGEPVPVVDLGALLGDSGEPDLTRFVTLRVASRRVALAVEAVLGLRDVETRVAREVPPLLRDVESDGIAAVAVLDGELLLVLRAARLVPEELWESLAWAPEPAEGEEP
jgi:purine-binding chemotaxis protein CheW